MGLVFSPAGAVDAGFDIGNTKFFVRHAGHDQGDVLRDTKVFAIASAAGHGFKGGGPIVFFFPVLDIGNPLNPRIKEVVHIQQFVFIGQTPDLGDHFDPLIDHGAGFCAIGGERAALNGVERHIGRGHPNNPKGKQESKTQAVMFDL